MSSGTGRRVNSTFVVSLTPFTASGDVDEPGLRRHLQRLAATGIGVYLAGSGSGEGYTLSRAERRRIFEIGTEELDGTVPVRAMGVEPRSAAEMIALAHDAAAAELDAVQVYSLDMGHGYLPTAAELGTYVHAVLDATTLPVVLSTHQSVGYWYSAELLDEVLTRHGHVVGLNVTSNDLRYVAQVIDAVAGRADVHVGGPMHALSALALGAQGYLSSEGNLAPQLCVSLVERHDAGDLAGAEAAYLRIMRLFDLTQRLGGIVGAKAALGLLGAPGGWPRPPRLAVPADRAQELADLVVALAPDDAAAMRSGGS
jgi:4-hydroxy-tetrahydrodipicolinate synthase